MARIVGMIQGQDGKAVKYGTRKSGLKTTAQCGNTAVLVHIYYDSRIRKDRIHIELAELLPRLNAVKKCETLFNSPITE